MSKEKSLSVTELKSLIKEYQKTNCPKLPSTKAALQALAQQYNIPVSKRSSVRLEQKERKSNAVAKVGTKANLISQLVQATGRPKSHFTKMLKAQLEQALQYENFSPPPPPPIPSQKPSLPSRPPPSRPIEYKQTEVPNVSTSNVQVPVSLPLQTKYPTAVRVMRIIETKSRPKAQPPSAKEKLQRKLKKKMEERKSKK